MARTLHANTQGQTRSFARVAVRPAPLDAERRRKLIREFKDRLLLEYPAAPGWLIGAVLSMDPRTVRRRRARLRRHRRVESLAHAG